MFAVGRQTDRGSAAMGRLRRKRLGGEARRQRLARSCGNNDIFHCRVLPSLVLSIGYRGSGKLSSERGIVLRSWYEYLPPRTGTHHERVGASSHRKAICQKPHATRWARQCHRPYAYISSAAALRATCRGVGLASPTPRPSPSRARLMRSGRGGGARRPLRQAAGRRCCGRRQSRRNGQALLTAAGRRRR